jgi:hypothetical protein
MDIIKAKPGDKISFMDNFTVKVMDETHIPIDRKIKPYINKFYKLGLHPCFSCEGHIRSNHFRPYIVFSFKGDLFKAMKFKMLAKHSLFSNVDINEYYGIYKVTIGADSSILRSFKTKCNLKRLFFEDLNVLLDLDLNEVV